MSLTIEQIEEQIASLQRNLETLKKPKLEVSRSFTGQYFAPYQGMVYRRMESDGTPIWESYLNIKKEWTILNSKESDALEQTYSKDCLSTPE
jgi:hypothetical protein